MREWVVRSVRLALVLAVVGVVYGCGGGGGVLTLDRIGREDAPNTMTLQLNASYTHQSSTPSWADGFEKLFTKFAEEHPDWKMELEIVPDDQTTQEQARLLEEARVGRAPDCANVDSFVVAHDGKMYAYWFATDGRILYRRTDLVPEAPRTWDELIQAAKAAEEKDPKVDGYLFNGGRWEGTTFDNLAHFWSQGGELVDEQGKPIFGEEPNRTYMLNEMNFLKETVESGASPQRVSTIKDYAEFEAAAQAQEVAMFQGGDFQYAPLKESLPPEEFKKWEVSLLPTRSAGDTPASGSGGWTIGSFSDDPKKVEMCMEFTKDVFIGGMNEVTGQLPTNPKYFNTIDKFDEPIYDDFRVMLEHGKARPGVPVYPTMSEELQIAIGTVLTGEATPEEALDRAYKASLSAYQEQKK